MGTLEKSAKCLICFNPTENRICVPTNLCKKILNNCTTYLHSALTKESLKEIDGQNESQLPPLCKSCFDSVYELMQLSELLAKQQKKISDLTVTFSLAVFHRRHISESNKVQNNNQSGNKAAIIELDVSCLPSYQFKEKIETQSAKNSYKTNPLVSAIGPESSFEVANVKYEIIDIDCQLGNNIPENCQTDIADDEHDPTILLSEKSKDKTFNEQTVQNLIQPILPNEIKNLDTTGNNDCNKSTMNGVNISGLLKTVTMPELCLERVKIVSQKLNVSITDPHQEIPVIAQQILNSALNKNTELSNPFDTKKLFKGQFCDEHFGLKLHRKTHQETHIKTQSGPHNSSVCNDTLTSSENLQIHQKVHTNNKSEVKKLFSCSFCKRKFTTKYSLERHERLHTGNVFQCSFCDEIFFERYKMRRHEKYHSGEHPLEYNTEANGNFISKNLTATEKIETATEKNETAKEKIGTCTENNGTVTEKNGSTTIYNGKVCQLVPAENNHYECSVCGQKFSGYLGLQCHEKYHTKRKIKPSHICSFCKKQFYSKFNLERHKRCYSGRGLKCSFGNKIILNRNKMIIHEKSRIGEILFECSICNMRFSTVCNLKIHEITHAREKAKGSVSKEGTVPLSKIKLRLRLNDGVKRYECSVCGKKFSTCSGLHYHRRTHTGIRPFKCSFCEKRFFTPQAVIIHERLHTGEKPFKCQYCNMTFRQQSHRTRHQNRTHNDEDGIG